MSIFFCNNLKPNAFITDVNIGRVPSFLKKLSEHLDMPVNNAVNIKTGNNNFKLGIMRESVDTIILYNITYKMYSEKSIDSKYRLDKIRLSNSLYTLEISQLAKNYNDFQKNMKDLYIESGPLIESQ